VRFPQVITCKTVRVNFLSELSGLGRVPAKWGLTAEFRPMGNWTDGTHPSTGYRPKKPTWFVAIFLEIETKIGL
jgi:hypothetical protein